MIGSFPHHDPVPLCTRLLETLDIPAWPQLPRRSFLENMYVQYSARLPGIQLDMTNEKVFFDTRHDLAAALESFYEHVLADDLDYFALPEDRAAGFYTFIKQAAEQRLPAVKGHITGPFSLGLTVTDQDLRASLYHPELADTIVQNAAFGARWQVRALKQVAEEVLIFVDEPYMASFGSAYINLSQAEVAAMLAEVFAAIHQAGGQAGVHCCGNTDWPVLLNTQVDVLNLDALSYLEGLTLYPHALNAFLERGGRVAWGMVPNNDMIFNINADQLNDKLAAGFNLVSDRAANQQVSISPAALRRGGLLTPACGLGSADEATAEAVLDLLGQMN